MCQETVAFGVVFGVYSLGELVERLSVTLKVPYDVYNFAYHFDSVN